MLLSAHPSTEYTADPARASQTAASISAPIAERLAVTEIQGFIWGCLANSSRPSNVNARVIDPKKMA